MSLTKLPSQLVVADMYYDVYYAAVIASNGSSPLCRVTAVEVRAAAVALVLWSRQLSIGCFYLNKTRA
jgi:hypothetical protein